jgi:hypothetical protein
MEIHDPLPLGQLLKQGDSGMEMQTETVVILLFLLASVVAVITRKLRTPYTVALMLVGPGLGTLHDPSNPQEMTIHAGLQCHSG